MIEEDRAVTADLIVYADYVCPYCYLAEATLAPLRNEGVRIEARPFELRPAPVPLPTMEERYYREAWEQNVVPMAVALGVEGMRRPRFATRTRKAHEAAAFAQEQGAGDVMRGALYRAYFEQGRDIGRVDVLVEIGVEAGLDRTQLKVALDVDKYTDAVLAMQAEGRAWHVRAVPATIVHSGETRPRMILGVRSTEELRGLLDDRATARENGDEE